MEVTELREKRAILELQQMNGVKRGAAITLGGVEHIGPDAGQHFLGAIRNTGPYMAEEISVTAALGAMPDRRPVLIPSRLFSTGWTISATYKA